MSPLDRASADAIAGGPAVVAPATGTPARPRLSARFRPGQLLRLALADLWHERWLAFCAACVLAATLAPLWTLWGLERGVIGTLVDRQNADPVMRLVVPNTSGGKRFDAEWFARVRSWPEVAFVLPTVRSLASQVDLFAAGASQPLRVELLPTGAGDPVLGRLPMPSGNQVLLSTPAAQRLSLTTPTDKPLRMYFERRRDGEIESATVDLQVIGILPLAQTESNAILAAPDLPDAVQAWRDGYVVERFGPGGSGPMPPAPDHSLFRLYARTIHDVATLADRLEQQGTSTFTRAREIASTLNLQSNLRAVLLLIGSITGIGAVVALTALQMSAVRRKRRDYALLKLTGHGRAWLVSLPCANAVAVALLGGVLAALFYAVTAWSINVYFSSQLVTGEAAVRLLPVDFAAGLAAAGLVSVVPAIWGGWRASRVEAADELREQ